MRQTKRYTVIITLLAALGLAACTSTPPISAIELVAEDRTFDDQKADTKIKAGIITDINNRMSTKLAAFLNVDVYEQRVMLTGAVEDAAIRAKVGSLARDYPGVKTVINEIQVVPADGSDAGDVIDDIVIEEKLGLKLASTSGVNHTNWRHRSVNGVVYLFGRSLSRAEAGRVVGVARDTKDVRKVVNHAVVRAE